MLIAAIPQKMMMMLNHPQKTCVPIAETPRKIEVSEDNEDSEDDANPAHYGVTMFRGYLVLTYDLCPGQAMSWELSLSLFVVVSVRFCCLGGFPG